MATKDLVLICAHGMKGMIDVKETDTLADVRQLIMEELDDDLIVENFAFHVNDCRISAKQEKKKLAWSIIGKAVSLQSIAETRKRAMEDSLGTNNDHVAKKTRVDRDDVSTSMHSQVTPVSSTRRNELLEVEETVNHLPIKEDETDASTSPVKSKSLDSVFQSAERTNTELDSSRQEEPKDDEKEDTSDIEMDSTSNNQNADYGNASDDDDDDIGDASNVDVLNMDSLGDQEGSESNGIAPPKKPEPQIPLDLRSKSGHQKVATLFDEGKESVEKSQSRADFKKWSEILTPLIRAHFNNTELDSSRPEEAKADEKEDTSGIEMDSTSNNQNADFGNASDDDDDDISDASTVDLLNMDSLGDQESSESNGIDSPKKPEPHKPEPQIPIDLRSKSGHQKEATLTDECKESVEKSRAVLGSIQKILEENELFCSNDRRDEWLKEILGLLNSFEPKTTIGVLGNTGVGKSSLLNALLDEASVLPTSGSRGCTAAVVELRFNSDMENANADQQQVACYRGDVEFMTLQEWQTELKILVDECSTHEKTVYALEPDPQSAAEAAAAWTKIDQVYGKGTMRRFTRQPSATVFHSLANDFRVKRLLTAEPRSGKQYNVISVSEGFVVPGSDEARGFLANHQDMNRKSRRTRNKWASDFRAKINSYVYRKGNGDQAQTWPLIRKVVLHGPWACLSTGACLVDLPGVRDANAARAKVAEQYLQNCSQIWVVAPIKRAVDDGTAKELLGEQFRRRLLMDGQYGNVSFICTQTDDCEATEIMRDHFDVAQNVPGRWEEMIDILDKINCYESIMNKFSNEEETLKDKWEDAEFLASEKNEELIELQDECDDDSEEVVRAKQYLEKARTHADNMMHELSTWKEKHLTEMEQTQFACAVEQRKLKTLCALVRNEYSTKQLQLDFRAGLKELYRKSNDEVESDGEERSTTALPDDFNMDVYCISSNDYLKIQGIKPKSDGPPTTFSEAEDTNIPELRNFVHGITMNHRLTFAKAFVNNTSDMVDRMKLLAIGAAQVSSGRSSIQCMRLFDREVEQIGAKIDPLASDFANKMKDKVKKNLQPALATGAQKGMNAAMPVVNSWGSKNRRTKYHRTPENNGLYWATYQATVRRAGVFNSGSAGPIDMNQELCDPMEKEFSVDWQRTLDSALRIHLADAERKVSDICESVNKVLQNSFEEVGMDKTRLANMSITANRGCQNAVEAAFSSMRKLATDTQRNLTRSLLPQVQESMNDSYHACLRVQRGAGVFNRMKEAMETSTYRRVSTMFETSSGSLLKGIDNLVQQLVTLIGQTAQTINKHLEDVYSIYWDDQNDESKMVDPEMQRKVRLCRDGLLPDLNKLCADLLNIQMLVGIEREALDLDVTAVETVDDVIKPTINDTKEAGDVIDLCDSDEEIEDVLAKFPPTKNITSNMKAEDSFNVKAEP